MTHLEFDSFDGAEPLHLTDKKIYVGGGMEVDYENTVTSGVGANWAMKTIRIYIPAPGGNAGVAELDPDASSPADHSYQVYHYDHLGSLLGITEWGETDTYLPSLFFNDEAVKESLYSYDPFGQRRDPADWIDSPRSQMGTGSYGDDIYTLGWDDPATTSVDEDDPSPRGYTGHEMLDDLGLVHMNGRIYDPMLGMFLSADVKIDGAMSLQGYNRYSYVHNNPLRDHDPSGYALEDLIPPIVRDQIQNDLAPFVDFGKEVFHSFEDNVQVKVGVGPGVKAKVRILGKKVEAGIGAALEGRLGGGEPPAARIVAEGKVQAKLGGRFQGELGGETSLTTDDPHAQTTAAALISVPWTSKQHFAAGADYDSTRPEGKRVGLIPPGLYTESGDADNGESAKFESLGTVEGEAHAGVVKVSVKADLSRLTSDVIDAFRNLLNLIH